MNGFTIDTLEREKEKIVKISSDLAFLYLNNITLINDFTASEIRLAESYISDVKCGRMTYSDAMLKLKKQYDNLYKMHLETHMEQMKFYALIQKEQERNSITTLILKQVGFIGGLLQFTGGLGICYKDIGAACRFLGTPLLMHGAENLWENGYYLVLRRDPKDMPLRDFYKQVANIFGGSDKSGDIAYSVGDIAISMASMFRTVLREDAWKLYYNIRSDFIMGWQDMGVGGVIGELLGDSASGLSIYQLMNDGEDWDNLHEDISTDY